MRTAHPSSRGRRGLVRTVLCAVAASFMLFSFSVALQRVMFSPAPQADADVSASGSTRAPRPSSRPRTTVALSSEGEDGGALDLGAEGLRGPTPSGRPPGFASRPTEAAGASSTARAATASDAPARSWSDAFSGLSTLFSPGSGGGTAGGTGTVGSEGSPSSAGSSSGTPQVKEIFFSTQEQTACQPGSQQFTLDSVRDLYVCVVWSGVAGKYAEQLMFVAPDGHVYQKVTVPFVTVNAGATDPTIETEGQKLQVKPAGWGANGEALVTAALPVAGTHITQHTLAGAWTVQVTLNGQTLGQSTFELLAE